MSSILTTLIKFDSKNHEKDTTQNQRWTLDAATQKELRALVLGPAEACPERLFLKEKADRDFQSAATVASQASMRLGFSIKTAPDKRYLDLAKGTNMLAECISQLEVRRALNHGWDPSHIILNGPGKWWPDPKKVPEGLFAVFCDSLTELERLIHSGRSDQHWGVRLKIPSQGSRFGVELEEPDDFNELCRLIRQFPKGMGCAVHMHMSPTMLGEGFWLDTVGSALAWAERIADQTGREIPILDLGGGYHPRDFAKTPFARIRHEAAARLPGFKYLIAEPGRAVTQENMVLHTRVLDVRRFQGELQDIVIDASIAELPLARGYPHRFIWAPLSGDWHEIPRGPVKVLGRICMEDDILSGGLAIPNSIKIGDRILITDAGAYERSMSYEFARGGLGSTEGMADSSYL